MEVYQRAMDALVLVHRLVLELPDLEKYDLASQLRRASKSIPANIAEGYAKRRSAREFVAFLTNAVGSANEVEVHLEIGLRLEYFIADRVEPLIEEICSHRTPVKRTDSELEQSGLPPRNDQ